MKNHRSHQNKCYNLGQREGRGIEGSLDFTIIFAFNLICAQLPLFLSLLFLCWISREPHTQVSSSKSSHCEVGELWVAEWFSQPSDL